MEAGKQRYDMDERQMEVEAVEASVKRMKDLPVRKICIQN